jgi:hypothetical protein
MLRTRVSLIAFSVALAGAASGQVTVFQGDHAAWAAAAGALRTLITFDDFALASGASSAIAADHYPGLTLAGIPSVPGSGAPFALNPNATDRSNGVQPVSEFNVLQLGSPAIRNGILEITFDTPIIAFGGYFIDVETSQAAPSTGIWTNADNIRYGYGGSFGNGTKHFIGMVSNTPFTKARIHLASDVSPSTDGLAFDNMEYAVPAPGVAGLFGLAAVLGGRRRR